MMGAVMCQAETSSSIAVRAAPCATNGLLPLSASARCLRAPATRTGTPSLSGVHRHHRLICTRKLSKRRPPWGATGQSGPHWTVAVAGKFSDFGINLRLETRIYRHPVDEPFVSVNLVLSAAPGGRVPASLANCQRVGTIRRGTRCFSINGTCVQLVRATDNNLDQPCEYTQAYECRGY